MHRRPRTSERCPLALLRFISEFCRSKSSSGSRSNWRPTYALEQLAAKIPLWTRSTPHFSRPASSDPPRARLADDLHPGTGSPAGRPQDPATAEQLDSGSKLRAPVLAEGRARYAPQRPCSRRGAVQASRRTAPLTPAAEYQAAPHVISSISGSDGPARVEVPTWPERHQCPEQDHRPHELLLKDTAEQNTQARRGHHHQGLARRDLFQQGHGPQQMVQAGAARRSAPRPPGASANSRLASLATPPEFSGPAEPG